MTYAIVDCSQKASMKIKVEPGVVPAPAFDNDNPTTKYPFDALEVGKAFAVPFSAGRESSIRSIALQRGRRDGKKFAVITHSHLELFEVARIG